MPASPSLLIVPARFKTGKLYTQIATTSAGVVLASSGDFNVTRALTATRFNSAGLIESVASGVPRLDYYTSGGTAGCPALLVEPSGTNLVVQSQNWLASGWRSDATANVTTVSATTGTLDPLGTNTANAISPTSGSATHLKVGSDGSASFTSGTIYTQSGFFKQGTGNAGRYVQLTYQATRFTQEGYANFDLQLGTVAVVSGTTADSNRAASIENYGNGWYRCRLTATCNSTGTGNGFTGVLITASGDTRAPSFSGTITDVLYGWGAQTEIGSIATSYIPTTTASATRNADVITLSGAVSGCIGQTEGTIYAEVDVRNFINGSRIVCLSDGTSDNRIIIQEGANSTLQAIVTNATSGVVDISTASGRTAGIYKIAIGYKQDDFAVYVNGSQTGTDNTGGVPTCNQIFIGKIETTATTNQLNDRIRAAALYTTRLTDSELAALTTL